jgi:hypothetical protein
METIAQQASTAMAARRPPATRRTAMGHPDGAHTHGSGGSGLGDILAIAGVILILAAVAGPVAAAAVSLLHVLLIAAAVCLGLAGVALAGFIAWRLYRWRHPGAARATALPPGVARAASRSRSRSGPPSNARRRSTCTCTASRPRTSPPSSPEATIPATHPDRLAGAGPDR